MKKLFSILLIFVFILGVKAQEKELPPKGGTPKGFSLPKKEVITLDNGLRLVMIPYGSLPKATINLTVKTGNIHENENQVWLSDLVADLLEEGSETKNAKEIANAIAGMGGNLNIGVGNHTFTLSSSVLYEFAPKAVSLMSDVILHPKFPESELERLKNNIKRNVSVSLSQPGSQASRDFYAVMYPDHPYGRVFPKPEQIDSYTIEDIKNHYKANFGAQRTTIYVVGKFNKQKVEEAVKNAFKDWVKGPEDAYPIAKANTNYAVQIIDRPGAPQSTIYFGLPTIDPSHKDHTSLEITNSILGGAFGSRITRNIREDKGYTYSPYSSLQSNYKTGLWYEVADVTTEHTGASLDEIKKEIVRLQNEPPSVEELEGIKNYESGIYVLQNSTPGGIIGQLNFLDIHDLDDSYLTNRVNSIMAVKPEDVQQMTAKYIQPEKMTLIVVGDKKKIKKQIDKSFKIKEDIKQ